MKKENNTEKVLKEKQISTETNNELPDYSEELIKFPISNISGIERPQIEKISSENVNILRKKISDLFFI